MSLFGEYKKLLLNRVLNQHEIEIATSGSSESDKNNRFWMYIDINEVNQVVRCLIVFWNNDLMFCVVFSEKRILRSLDTNSTNVYRPRPSVSFI